MSQKENQQVKGHYDSCIKVYLTLLHIAKTIFTTFCDGVVLKSQCCNILVGYRLGNMQLYMSQQHVEACCFINTFKIQI